MATVLEPTQTLNIKGMQCPMPLVWAKNVIATLKPGETLEILATDRSSVSNFKAFSEATGHELLDWREENGVIRLLVRKAGG